MRKTYVCPQCSGRLTSNGGDFTCQECGLNVTEVLKNVAARNGPLSDVAEQFLCELSA